MATTGIEAMKQRTGLASAPKTLEDMVYTIAPKLQKMAAKHMSAERLLSIAVSMQKRDNKIAACTPASLLGCVTMSAITGLEPGVFGQCYYIPYGNTLTFIPGWQGYAQLIANTGRSEAWTGAVYAGDHFRYSLGSKPFLDHEPLEELTEADVQGGRPLTHCYAIGFVKGSERPIIEVWSKAKIAAHRDRYNKVGAKHYSFTNLHNFEMYGRKVAFLQVIKYLPKSAEIQQVAALDYAADAGMQSLTPEMAMSGPMMELTAESQERTTQAPESPLAEMFRLLGWDVDTQAKWIKANENLSESDRVEKLKAKLNETA